MKKLLIATFMTLFLTTGKVYAMDKENTLKKKALVMN